MSIEEAAAKRINNRISKKKTLTLQEWCENNPERGTDLLAEWADKNDKTPSDYTYGSKAKVWWICKKGHEWLACPNNRISGTGCPYCAGRLPIKGETDLATMYPEVAVEWNYEKNGELKPDDISYGSSKKVWWICSKGHEWQSSVSHRTNGRGCPICNGEKSTSFPEQALLYYIKKMFPDAVSRYKPEWLKRKSAISEIDIYIPSAMIGIEYDGQKYHTSVERDEKKDILVSEKNIGLYRIREPLCPLLSTNSKCIYIQQTNSQFYYEEAFKELFAILSLAYSISPVDVNIKRDYAYILESYSFIEKSNSFIKIKPELLKEWDYERNNINPITLSYGSKHFAWWNCSICNNQWQDTIKHRVQGRGCPKCGIKNRSTVRMKNKIDNNKTISLQKWCEENLDIGEHLLSEWDPTNDASPKDYSFGSRKKVKWICPNGHAVSLGGDCDTLTCIAAGIAEAFYGVPEKYKNETLNRLEDDMRDVYVRFCKSTI